MQVLIFGTGDYYHRYKKWFNQENIIALLDNNKEKQHTKLDGHLILSPQDGVKLTYDRIYILSVYDKAMRQQLLDLGVSSDKVYNQFDLRRGLHSSIRKKPLNILCMDHKFTTLCSESKQKILLLSYDLRLNGASMAALYAARALLQSGYDVVVGTSEGGEICQELLNLNIPVVVDANLQIETACDAEWIQQFSVVICNTMNYYQFLSMRNLSQYFIWWLHDSELFYDSLDKKILCSIVPDRLAVYAVGPVPRNAFQKYLPEISVHTLLYGIPDVGYLPPLKHEKVIFALIGLVQMRKGQDLFVEAVKRLPESLREMAEFWIVGDDSSLFAQKVHADAAQVSQIRFWGECGRTAMQNLYPKISVLVAPSREDPMPVVATEAMMYYRPCIVSNVAGTAEYIENGKNGWICETEDVEDLKDKMLCALEHPEKLEIMGRKARKIYDSYFSMTVFERNLLTAVQKCKVD